MKNNKDPYGKCCVDVARRVMQILDENPARPIRKNGNKFSPYEIIVQANHEIKAEGITGFMAGCVAQMVSNCHTRGSEFRRAWNLSYQIHVEGKKANRSGAILNPALITFSAAVTGS